MRERSGSQIPDVILALALTALLLIARPWASKLVGVAEGGLGMHLLGTVILLLIGLGVALAILSARQNFRLLAIPTAALLIVHFPFFLSPLFAGQFGVPYWLPPWWEWMFWAFDTHVLIGALIGVTISYWNSRGQDSSSQEAEIHPVDASTP